MKQGGERHAEPIHGLNRDAGEPNQRHGTGKRGGFVVRCCVRLKAVGKSEASLHA